MALKDVPGIIEAIGNIHNANLQGANLAETVRRNKADESLRQQQHDLAVSSAQRQQELEEEQHDIERQQNDVNSRMAAFQALGPMKEFLAQGGSQADLQSMMGQSLQNIAPLLAQKVQNVAPPAAPPPPPQQNNSLLPYRPQPDQSPNASIAPPGAPIIDPNLGARLQANKLATIRAEAGAQAGGTAEAVEPYRIASDKRLSADQEARDARLNAYSVAAANAQNQFDRDKAYQQQTFEASQNAMNRVKDLDVAKLSRGTQLSIAGMENDTMLKRIGAEYGIDPTHAAVLQMDMFAGGGVKPDLNNPVMRKLVADGEAQGFKNPGTDIDELKKLNSIQEQDLPAFKDFANTQLSTSGVGTKTQKLVSSIWPTDAGKAEDMLKTRFQSVGKGLEGYNGSRQLASQFSAESSSMPNLSDKKEQGLAKVNNMDNMINGRKYEILKNYSPQQVELFQAHNPGVNFNIRMKAPDGTIKEVPPGKVEGYIKSGAKVVQ